MCRSDKLEFLIYKLTQILLEKMNFAQHITCVCVYNIYQQSFQCVF